MSDSKFGFPRPARLLAGLFSLSGAVMFAAPPPVTLMPVPTRLQFTEGRLPVTATWKIAVRGHDDTRLRDGLTRMLHRLQERTGLTLSHTTNGAFAVGSDPADANLVIECGGPGATVPVMGEDESYTLAVTSSQAVLRAPTVLGALHGFETLLQLLQADATGWHVPAVVIEDAPRFPWRGLMIDVARHWQPMEVITRNLDGMALVKLNVLHLHLTEDQGFRIESKLFPRLHEFGSDGHYFTQEQMREIIAYAAARGIRVVPEFDIPGHATSWVVGHPELASQPGPYVIERKWGIFDPVLDPTNEEVYRLLDGFLGEMAALFPDAYLHIGGDENNGVHWSANPKIQAFIREHNLKDNPGLHAYFNTRVHGILAELGKRLIGWDEILHPDLPAGSVIHSWRGPEGIADATKQGFATVLSNGYYIDLSHPTSLHYLNDPAPEGSPLTPDQQKLVLGGEATMWSEWVTPETIDSRIWPRTAAIAERLWSPREVRDLTDMYRRLALVSQRLEETGLRHESYLDPALRRLAGDGASAADLAALRSFVDLLEPVKGYQRGQQQPGSNQFTPLTGLVDCTRPDSAPTRVFAASVEDWVHGAADGRAVIGQLEEWQQVATVLERGLTIRSPRLAEAVPLVQSLQAASAVGREVAHLLATGQAPAADWLPAQLTKIDHVAQPHAAAEFPLVAPLRLLVVAAARQDLRKTLGADAWRQYLNEQLAAAAPKP